MPLKLVPPDLARRRPFYRVRGTYHGVYLDRSTETANKATAQRVLSGWAKQIERGEIRGKGELTFDQAVVSYLQAGGDPRFLDKIVQAVGPSILAREMDQARVDALAAELHPDSAPATRNRQVYTPVLAVLRHAKIPHAIDRPKGASGNQRHIWIEQSDFEKVHAEAQRRDPETALLLLLIFFTGLRLGEALSAQREKIDLSKEALFVGKTKNGHPRSVYLPPVLVAALSAELARADTGPLFPTLPDKRRHGGSRFYAPVYAIYEAAGVDPQGAPFHVGRHSFGRAMTRAGADLVATNVWRSRQAAAVYQHFDHNEEARKAALIPGAKGTRRLSVRFAV